MGNNLKPQTPMSPACTRDHALPPTPARLCLYYEQLPTPRSCLRSPDRSPQYLRRIQTSASKVVQSFSSSVALPTPSNTELKLWTTFSCRHGRSPVVPTGLRTEWLTERYGKQPDAPDANVASLCSRPCPPTHASEALFVLRTASNSAKLLAIPRPVAAISQAHPNERQQSSAEL